MERSRRLGFPPAPPYPYLWGVYCCVCVCESERERVRDLPPSTWWHGWKLISDLHHGVGDQEPLVNVVETPAIPQRVGGPPARPQAPTHDGADHLVAINGYAIASDHARDQQRVGLGVRRACANAVVTACRLDGVRSSLSSGWQSGGGEGDWYARVRAEGEG